MTHPAFSLSVPEAVACIREKNPRINAFVSTRLGAALAEHEAPGNRAEAPLLPGVPYGLKDEWDTVCLPTTAGSWPHRTRQPLVDSAVFQAFDAAGAVLVGKTNLSDLGLAPESTNYIVGSTRNPFDASRTAGGSSGGAAAAVATGMVAFDWGTDIGGSIRWPAAFCGVLGLRLASTSWPMTTELPRVPRVLTRLCAQGPLTRTTHQMRAVLDAARPHLMKGQPHALSPRGFVVHAPRHTGHWPGFVQDVTPHLKAAFDCEVRPAHELPDTDHAMRVYSGLWSAHLEQLLEADPTVGTLPQALLSALSALVFRGALGDRRFHPGCAELLVLMALGRVTIYRDAAQVLRQAARIREAYEAVWDRGLIVVAPVCAYPPPRLGRTNYNTHLLDCTVGGNLSDATGLSIPFGRFGHLPRSVQLLGPSGCEESLLGLADRLIASRDRDPAQKPVGLPD